MYDLEADDPCLARPCSGRRKPIVHDLAPTPDDFRAAVLEGLSLPDKALPCRFLYDAAGSQLFDQICDLPEYYPTRTETRILRDHADEIARRVGADVQLVELGSGSSTKVRILLDALDAPLAYVPIDISFEHLTNAAQAIQDDYDLRVEAVCADYSQAFDLPPSYLGRRVGFYPGSTIGNLTPDQARDFLKLWAERLGPGSALLIGVDLRKSADILEPAYDDRQGVTAAFSLNLLARANRELDADFDLTQFRHQARWLEHEGRVAIHLRALSDQTVTIAGQVFSFRAGELIHIEDSWKYSLAGFRELASASGFDPVDYWVDDDNLFSVHLLDVRSPA
jgi:L-histidine N-alpha-methyltransferase